MTVRPPTPTFRHRKGADIGALAVPERRGSRDGVGRRVGWRAVVFGVAALAVLAAGGCSKGDEATTPNAAGTTVPATSKLTQEQAAELSQVLFKNFDAGGATVDVVVPYNSTATFRIHAEVDFKDSKGRGTLDTTFTDGRPPEHQEIAWTDKQAAITDSDGKWQQRLLEPTRYPVDQVLALVNGLASETRDNPALLRQGPSQFLRTETVGTTPVDVYRYGERTTWFVDDAGALVRLTAEIPSFGGPVSIDLRNPGTRSVDLP